MVNRFAFDGGAGHFHKESLVVGRWSSAKAKQDEIYGARRCGAMTEFSAIEEKPMEKQVLTSRRARAERGRADCEEQCRIADCRLPIAELPNCRIAELPNCRIAELPNLRSLQGSCRRSNLPPHEDKSEEFLVGETCVTPKHVPWPAGRFEQVCSKTRMARTWVWRGPFDVAQGKGPALQVHAGRLDAGPAGFPK
jgi:hypothetical protein